MSTDQIAHNVGVGLKVREAIELLGDDFDDEHWLRLRDELIAMHPLPKADTPAEIDLFRFGNEVMQFGKHRGDPIREVPLEYLDWLCREQENFYAKLRAYLKANRNNYDIEETQ